MRKIITTLALMGGLGLGLYAHGAMAQEDGAQILKPAEGWKVTPARFGADDTGLKYCYLRTAYDNGFVFRFRGDSAQLSVLDINFRQPVFSPGLDYTFQMSVDDNAPQSVNAKALTKRSLRLDVSDLTGGALLDGKAHSMALRSQHQAFVFHLDGIAGGIDKLKQCAPVGPPIMQTEAVMPEAPKVVQVEPELTQSVSPQPQKADVEQKTAQGYTSEKRVSRADLVKDTNPDMPITTIVAPNAHVWKALEGEHPRNIIERWARKAGRELEWDVYRQVNPLTHNFTYQGPIEDAVSALLNESYGVERTPKALFVDAPNMPDYDGINLSQHFVAIGGDSLFNTLQGWSGRAGVKLIWLPEDDFRVPQDGVEGKDFNETVGLLLSRYEEVNPRVAGTIYKESTGPVLVIEQVR